jgi:hypothetical protein
MGVEQAWRECIMKVSGVVNGRIARRLRSQTRTQAPWHAPRAQGERRHVRRRRAITLAEQKKDDK